MENSSLSLRKAALTAYEMQSTVPRLIPTQYRVKRVSSNNLATTWGVMKYMVNLTQAQNAMYPHGIPLGFVDMAESKPFPLPRGVV